MLNPTRSSRDKSRSCHASSAEFVSTLSAFSSCVRNASFSRPPSFTSNQTFQKHQARHNIQHQIFKPMDSTDRQRPKGEKLSSAQRRLRGRPRRTAPWPLNKLAGWQTGLRITRKPGNNPQATLHRREKTRATHNAPAKENVAGTVRRSGPRVEGDMLRYR